MAQSSRVTEGHWHRVVMKTEAGLGQPAEEGCKSPELAATGAVPVCAIQTGGSWWGGGSWDEIGRSQSSWGTMFHDQFCRLKVSMEGLS